MGCLVVWSVAYAKSLKPYASIEKINVESIQPSPVVRLEPKNQKTSLLAHPIRASHIVSPETLRQYLLSKKSPLAEYSLQISNSPFSSTIIAITAAEQSFSKRPVSSPNNLYGLVSHGKLIQFSTLKEGIQAIDSFLRRADENNKSTIESFRTYKTPDGKFHAVYCYTDENPEHICWNWESTVLKTKAELESLQ